MTVINSLADLPGATPQQIFDQAANHLWQQGARCVEPVDIEEWAESTWANDAGLRCAVGCFMDDADIETATSWGWTSPRELPIWEKLSDKQQAILFGLQCIHDNVTPFDWQRELTALALTHNLVMPSESGMYEARSHTSH